jgi:hypothetical protein
MLMKTIPPHPVRDDRRNTRWACTSGGRFVEAQCAVEPWT